MMEGRQEYQPVRCVICSTGQRPIIHRHFSSLWLREVTGVETAGTPHLCPSCKSRHVPYPYSRTKIVVSDSTLHVFFAPPGHTGSHYPGDLMHSDYITIPGATIDSLANAFRLEYGQSTRPMDVVLIAGYNDLVVGRSRADIMQSFRRFTQIVLNASPRDQEKSTVAVCNMMYPPQITWFPDNGHLPENHGGNDLLKLEIINECILSLNLDNGITEFPRLHKYGVRNYTKKESSSVIVSNTGEKRSQLECCTW